MTQLFRRLALAIITARGRRYGAPTVIFPDRTISVSGGDIYVKTGIIRWLIRLLTETSGFYLTLPPNVFGLVIFPDGTSHNMAGGLHEVPPGLYKLQYVDGHERLEFLSPISEMSTDGEKVTLKVVIRYRVIDPITALRINRPVETLIEHVETDVAQYIRTHNHTDLADSSEEGQEGRLRSFFVQRHGQRFPLSRAFMITGIEIKEFSGDEELLDIRRRADIESRKSQIEKEQARLQQELIVLRNQYKAETEKMISVHTAELAKKGAEYRAEIENIEARHVKEKQEILHKTELMKIDLENKRTQLQRDEEEVTKLIEMFARQFSSGVPVNPAAMKTMADLLTAYKEKMDNELFSSPSKSDSSTSEDLAARSSATSTTSSDIKVKNLTNTLLNLLNPKK